MPTLFGADFKYVGLLRLLRRGLEKAQKLAEGHSNNVAISATDLNTN